MIERRLPRGAVRGASDDHRQFEFMIGAAVKATKLDAPRRASDRAGGFQEQADLVDLAQLMLEEGVTISFGFFEMGLGD